uniref:hypothetical protein n=1 Tax=Pararhizobium sp. IMCC3301 TaxID=3067904 RepID=UPI0027417E1D|nr:hypothetical protein [Pararhizobium sp. IMCC3301]
MLLDETYPLATRHQHPTAHSFSARIEKAYDQATAPDGPRFKLAGLRHKPGELLNFVRCHSARARRHTLPRRKLVIECYAPDGAMAVEISFGESRHEA